MFPVTVGSNNLADDSVLVGESDVVGGSGPMCLAVGG